MDQVVGDVDAGECGGERGRVAHIADDYFDLAGPRNVAQPAGIARQAPDVVTGAQQAGDEPPADVPGGARDQTAHTSRVTRTAGEPPVEFSK
ncbi:hypothetical protein GCM10009835_37070 [Planosporangium flavigriseum]|uniref:Uncharacterized protein n=1 Tax=Planosporangium flavigriseum TaxID=373681 RepID=A0A8J3LP32_9ACTN|nr:hypothetical protein Pfl04_26590 [Planosporangium flavigriseum]